jgi:hypothetical protein
MPSGPVRLGLAGVQDKVGKKKGKAGIDMLNGILTKSQETMKDASPYSKSKKK